MGFKVINIKKMLDTQRLRNKIEKLNKLQNKLVTLENMSNLPTLTEFNKYQFKQIFQGHQLVELRDLQTKALDIEIDNFKR